jgi:hypothetical protein
MEEMKNAHKILVGKPERKRSFVTPTRKWEDNIKMDLKERGFERADRMNWLIIATICGLL